MISVTKIVGDFEINRFRDVIARPLLEDKKAAEAVSEIVEKVRVEGDAALFKYSKEFDGVDLADQGLAVSEEERKEAYSLVNSDFVSALRAAKRNITSFHRKNIPKSWSYSKDGIILGQLVCAITRVGIYVPGGQATYPSSVLMNAIPPQVAGVEEIAMCVPAQKTGKVNPYTLVAADEVGLKEIYKVGGAQAIAALAYGTETIRRVDKICGPGSIYVTLAKKVVMGDVGIDMLAGPSEIVVLADENASAQFIAADILAQAEHDAKASAFLITISEQLAEEVKHELEQQLLELSRKEIISKSLKENGRIFILDSLEIALKLVNALAPEHLEIMVNKPRKMLSQIRNAGAIFLGSYSPEAVGDYIAGPNHILPTLGTARFSSPLNTADFYKNSSIIFYSQDSLKRASSYIEAIAEAEGLDAHANSVKVRVKK